MLRGTQACRFGTFSTALAGGALLAAACLGVTDPFGVLFLGGAVFRALSLPATVYGDCCLARVACALPELQEAHHEYKAIVDHPRAILWEKRVAAQKLKNDRERIFRSHHTDNVRLVLPHLAALAASCYSLCTPAQQLGECVGVAAVAAPVSLSALGLTVDPTLAVAATLTLLNTRDHLQRRMGFNDGLDAWIRQTQRHMTLMWGAFAAAVLLGQCLAGPAAVAHFFPPQLAPVWLGISVVSSCKSLLVNHTAPLRALFRIQDYPPTHGMHGAVATAEGHEYRLEFTGVDAEERREMWQTQKKALDYECNVRLHRMLKQLGLFDSVEEAEYEAENLRKKLNVARDRRKKLQQEAGGGDSADSATAFAGACREADVVGPSAEAVAERHFDELRREENARRQKRRNLRGS
ncbi:uncharacterized protein Tco025E_03434 [Trypanosoma conorhini]|uniref:Uncharacterized protein n=1 Tax=Trypanosoma conorhini TaxID=83891 RepID=A0A3R7L7K0_9TRYP|nr:uncharacterized protein Tco025E_03434 [Trypanosoma conorhini]RNF21354.1 hypothetical protein Tco025E_03434 [Trypanosoma conorhini]